MMNIDIKALLQSLNALHTGSHFVYTSGEHGDAYADLRVFNQEENRLHLEDLSLRLIEKLVRIAEIDISKQVTVIGPDTLGAIIAEAATRLHNKQYGTNFSWLRLKANKHEDGTKTFAWGDDYVSPQADAQVLYVDDLMNAGSTWEKCREMVETYGKVHAIGTIADRSNFIAHDLKVLYFVSLVKFTLERFKPDECPHCKNAVPIVRNLGHGQEFEQKNPNYNGKFIDL